ncbi:MAG: glutaredoxin family protein [Proteobacteria bacterium]|nr:glutaredoxin family protein [Pseudomonadota bacterium]
MRELQVFSCRGCHLCELLIEELLPLVEGRLTVEVCDIDSRDDWRDAYDTRIPVVKYDGEEICQYHLDRSALTRILSNTPS